MKITPVFKNEREFISLYLDIINVVTPEENKLTPSEKTLVTEFLLLPDKFKYSRFSSPAKAKVASSLSTSRLNINNKIHGLLKKKFLRRDEDGVVYLPNHLTKVFEDYRIQKEYSIQFVLKDDFKNKGSN